MAAANSPEVDAPDVKRTLRAEAILMAAIGLVSLLVVDEVVQRVRAARAQVILASQAQNDAEAIAARYAATGNRALLAEFDRAKTSSRAHLVQLRAIVASDADASAFVTRIENLIERRFNILDAEAASGPLARGAVETAE
jgi:CHASE3 domain sensor protein